MKRQRRRGCLREPTELARGILPFLADGKMRQGGAATAARPIRQRGPARAALKCRGSANERENYAPCPTWVLSSKRQRPGFSPITAAQGVNLDADWLAVFHRVHSLITFSPLLLTLSYHTGRRCSAHKTQTRAVIAKCELMNDSEAVCF